LRPRLRELGFEAKAEEEMFGLVKSTSNIVDGFLNSMLGMEAVAEEATWGLVKSKSNVDGLLNSRITGFLNSMFRVEAVAEEVTSGLVKLKSRSLHSPLFSIWIPTPFHGLHMDYFLAGNPAIFLFHTHYGIHMQSMDWSMWNPWNFH
jgi:hypothetical protein